MKNIIIKKLSNEIEMNCELLSEQGSSIFEHLPIVKKIKAFFEGKTDKTRSRIFEPWLVFKMLIMQRLDPDHSCLNAVKKYIFEDDSNSNISENTASYCTARKNLPELTLKECMQISGEDLHNNANDSWKFRGRALKIIDGSTLSMPDTKENQESYPQPASQKNGIGFPLARVVGVLCMSTGGVLDFAIGPQKGKKTGEHALLRQMLNVFKPSDIVLGDRYYDSYWLIAEFIKRQADVLFESSASRKSDFKSGIQLGKNDHVATWIKPAKPSWMDDSEYASFPDSIEVREFKVNTKIMVTTLLNSKKFHKKELNKLYYSRWNIEVDLRSIKSTLDMDILSCKTPEMVRKEIWAGLFGYNIIRSMISESAKVYKIKPRNISFKSCLQTLNLVFFPILIFCKRIFFKILKSIAGNTVGNRPNRKEPRAVKRRPKPYPRLDKPRSEYM